MTEEQIQLVVGLVRLQLRTIWPSCLPNMIPLLQNLSHNSLQNFSIIYQYHERQKTDNTSLFFKIFVIGFPSVLDKLNFFFRVLNTKKENGLQIMTLGARQP